MFPYRSMFRLLVTLSLLSLSAITVLMGLLSLITPADYYTDPDSFDKAIFYGKALLSSECYYVDDNLSFRSRVLKEFECKEHLAELSDEHIKNLTSQYYRNVSIQWKDRELLPPSKPLFDIQCLNYLDTDYGVTVSIVIPYYNELPILLMRTLTTIIHRTLPKYLKEIILIDDKSSINITEEVTKYAREQRMPIRYLHNEVRLGIANSRIKGMHVAEGDVVVILDSHMEVSELWLEPLLSTITSSPKAVTVPLLHMIQETEYQKYSTNVPLPYVVQPQKGFGLITLYVYTEKEAEERKQWEPFPTAGVMGGALAAYKSTLLQYYPQTIMGTSWGVENNRLSYRMWMCAEGAWVSPCSQVLHPNGNDWTLGRYFGDGSDGLLPKLLYESVAELINFIELDMDKEKLISKATGDEEMQKMIWDMSDDIRATFNPDKQECKAYEWYLSEVFEHYFSWQADQFEYVGEVRSVYDSRLCLETFSKRVGMYPCRSYIPNISDSHVMGFTRNHFVWNGLFEGKCWDTTTYEKRTEISLFGCHLNSPTEGKPFDSQRFIYNETTQQIVHPPSKRCLEFVNSTTAWMMKCDTEKREQLWEIEISAWF